MPLVCIGRPPELWPVCPPAPTGLDLWPGGGPYPAPCLPLASQEELTGFDHLQDLSDPQYNSFRSNLPSLLGLGSAQLTLRHSLPHLLALFSSSTSSRSPSPHALNAFHTLFALAALGVMHGCNALKVVGLVLVNHALSRQLAGGRHAVWAAWVFVGLALVGTEKTEGFRGLLPEALVRSAHTRLLTSAAHY